MKLENYFFRQYAETYCLVINMYFNIALYINVYFKSQPSTKLTKGIISLK